jgi:hypothetical protein
MNLTKVRRLKNYFMAIHRQLVKDIMTYVVYHAVTDRASMYFNPDWSTKENYDLQFNHDFLEIYCEDPPRAHYPNANARFKLRVIISAFNDEEASKEYRIYWLGTSAYEVWNRPLRIRAPEDYDGLELMFNFDFYWNLVLKFLGIRNAGNEVTTVMVRNEVNSYGRMASEAKMDIEKQPLETAEEEHQQEVDVDEPISPSLIA